ncbi:TIGR02757 family protein [Geomobilimonas luticola]|uniref:TIGR02757 family protein n=1 Tax=Geomobilimonas luticola TaxID=1114878 RepID=A0ABS5SBF0_9BACT|nr:TIGR02757 family protein [Geomobilimonas luticola]MBT0652704.1 TIGR02757 family protein [Geomobilimonas luticola]
MVNSKNLKTILDGLYAARSSRHLANDPLSFCHRYPDPADREIVGFIAAAFAYGNVKIILKNLEAVFAPMGPSPRRFVETFEPAGELRSYAGFKHRFNDHRDLCALLLAARTMLEEADSIGDYFLGCYDATAEDITPSLIEFTAALLAMDYTPVFGPAGIPADSYFPFFFPSPAAGSACKRLCMFLRWMVRPADGIDLGLWREVSPSKLVIPVDAHIQRIGRNLGLTFRRQADWRMAREITAALRKLDPADPVKYDFSLCHLGISEGCDGTVRPLCGECPVTTVCTERSS